MIHKHFMCDNIHPLQGWSISQTATLNQRISSVFKRKTEQDWGEIILRKTYLTSFTKLPCLFIFQASWQGRMCYSSWSSRLVCVWRLRWSSEKALHFLVAFNVAHKCNPTSSLVKVWGLSLSVGAKQGHERLLLPKKAREVVKFKGLIPSSKLRK